MNVAPHLAAGHAAEDHAFAMLRGAGLTPITRNYRCPQGELDLIMRDRDTLVIVEVRYRRQSGFGNAAETVDARKQSKLLLAAQHYLQQDTAMRRLPVRFDVVAVSDASDGTLRAEWIKDAFRADFQ